MQFFKSNSSSEKDASPTLPKYGENLVGAHNLRRIALYTYRNLFLLKDKTNQIKKQLWVDRHTYRPTEIRDQEDIPRNFTTMKEYSGVMGIITILDCPFLLMVEEVQHICTLMDKHKIYTISALTFIPFESEEFMDAERKKALVNYVMYLRKLLTQGYYFSLTYDLTIAHSKRIQKNAQTEPRFQWNYELYKDFIKFNIDQAWQLCLIQGYIGHFRTDFASSQLDYFVISRRSCLNAGTRYHARGIDDEANAANFVETEQLIFYQGKCCSHLQIRGSPPVFWTQKGVQASIKLERTFALTNHIFLKHMNNLNKTYGHVICINLLAKNKKDEQLISEAFEDHIKKNVLGGIGYEAFDFHQAVKNQNYEKTNILIAKIHPAVESMGVCIENMETGNLEYTQEGVIRTNCLDCLDRTNFIQSKIAMVGFDIAMSKLGINLKNAFGQEPYEELDNADLDIQNPLIVGFKSLWADNGDALSLHYTGTGSVISQVTRVGKKGFLGFFDHYAKSLNRFYNGSFEDNLKQDCLDFLLAKNISPVMNTVNESYENEIRAREKEFATYTKTSIYMVTWNLGGYILNQNLDLKPLFNFRNNPAPDFIIVGFQEYIELNASAVLSSTGKASVLQWIEMIIKTLKEHDNYILVSARDLVGLLLMIFVKEKVSKNVTLLDTDKVKTGLAGKVGNKGAVIAKLHVHDTSFCFVNCHLDPHAKKLEERIANLNDIHQKAFQEEGLGKRKKERIQNLDTIFLFGDLNFRVNLGNELRTLIKNIEFLKSMNQDEKAQMELAGLQAFDQLKIIQADDPNLRNYSEGQINFLPTYKYDIGTDDYDTSKKQRNPAWTDRIMWNTDGQGIEQLFYDRIEYKISDHRPVVSYFNAQVKKIDKEKKNSITKQVYNIQDVIIKAESQKLEVEEIKANDKDTTTIQMKITEIIMEDPPGMNDSQSKEKTNGKLNGEKESISPQHKLNSANGSLQENGHIKEEVKSE